MNEDTLNIYEAVLEKSTSNEFIRNNSLENNQP
jgi:hypothetical protein